jgi:hypothetical protein
MQLYQCLAQNVESPENKGSLIHNYASDVKIRWYRQLPK